MIQLNEMKLTCGTICMIGYDLGIEGYDFDEWMQDINKYNEYVNKVIEVLKVEGEQLNGQC